ncbi:hypothetical protein [Nannocystis sp. SCPEA4]|uniref:hypothetical protein n=1 Tax=Nannocystis sp. SCPEA4 TaxID=2996787 RepID=UPI0022709B16|nr:hypothetical protein [Nannocystis sp. SCPEA4]MCY1057506.1 hypothetical protein [Nannocystis sp. SCPEA4]
MVYTYHRLRYTAALALSFACDSGYSLHIDIELPEEVVAAYSEDQRGILYVDVRPGGGFDPVYRPVAVVCGETTRYSVENFGDGEVPDTRILAWIDPATGGTCGPIDRSWASADDKEVYPDKGEPQAEGMVQETSTCNHSEDVELVLSVS